MWLEIGYLPQNTQMIRLSHLLKVQLGNLAYEDMVSAAKLDSTIIDGGYIKTSLINANTIAAGTLIVSAINDSVDATQVGGRNLFAISTMNKNVVCWGTSSIEWARAETIFKSNSPNDWALLPLQQTTPLVPINTDV